MTESPKGQSGGRFWIGRIFRWLCLIVGAVATFTAGEFLYFRLAENSEPDETIRYTAVNFVAIAFCLWLLSPIFRRIFPPLIRLAKPFFFRLFTWRMMRRTLIGFAILATLIAIFYTEEDWRGKRAWENCKRELEAKGAVLDWNAYIPLPVPDDQNFFTASTNIALRFVKAQTEAQGEAASKLQWLRFGLMDAIVVADVEVISTNANAVPDADLYLRCAHSVVTVGTSHENFPEPPSPFLSHFELKNVPLKQAIEQMAKAANVDCVISSEVKSVDSKGNPLLLSIGWKNVTAREALYALLDNFDLVLVEDTQTGTARVLSTKHGVYVDPKAAKKIYEILAHEQSTNEFQGPVLQGSAGLPLFAKRVNPIKTARVVLLANETPNVQEIFSGNTVKLIGTNSFLIYGNPMAMSAEDYLKWSDQFVPAFDEIREALKRPYAIIPGDYSVPYLMPIPNFVTMRALAQTLAQRAQCDFLLGRPADALREVTLMHDMCRILEKPPIGKPVTLVEAMINVAISGLYTSTVADGFRLNAWLEPQLIALQEQLQNDNLAPYVFAAFKGEQAHTVYIGSRTDFSKLMTGELFGYGHKKTFRQALEARAYDFMPQGWVFQNLVIATQIHQRVIDTFDPAEKQVFPEKSDVAYREVIKKLERHSVFHLLADIAIPNYSKAIQTLAYNQTLANEAQIVCALERYKLANGNYPETLAALAPQFMEKIPHDIIGGEPLHYRRKDDGKFILYSVGWNETDDGGLPGTLSDVKNGDWVWQYPQN